VAAQSLPNPQLVALLSTRGPYRGTTGAVRQENGAARGNFFRAAKTQKGKLACEEFHATGEFLLGRSFCKETQFAYVQAIIPIPCIGSELAMPGSKQHQTLSPRRFVMKNFLLRLAVAFSVMAGMVALTAPSNAQQGKPTPQPPVVSQQQAQQQGQNDMQTQDAKPFNGTIVKEKGKLILKDTAANVSYQLDDQDRAKQFEGKQVRVVGKLDMNTNLIHVESIEAAS
jgi:hypothetical protein